MGSGSGWVWGSGSRSVWGRVEFGFGFSSGSSFEQVRVSNTVTMAITDERGRGRLEDDNAGSAGTSGTDLIIQTYPCDPTVSVTIWCVERRLKPRLQAQAHESQKGSNHRARALARQRGARSLGGKSRKRRSHASETSQTFGLPSSSYHLAPLSNLLAGHQIWVWR